MSEILTPTLSSTNVNISKEITKTLPKLICLTSSDCIKSFAIDPETHDLKIEIFCKKCNFQNYKRIDEKQEAGGNNIIHCKKIEMNENDFHSLVLRSLLKNLINDNADLKILILDVLPFCAGHMTKFWSLNVVKIWMERCGDPAEGVRRTFGGIIANLMESCQVQSSFFGRK